MENKIIDNKFRSWLKEEAETTETPQRSAHQKAQEKYRDKYSVESDWQNVAFFGPQSAVSAIKSAWEQYKNLHPDLWNETPEGVETPAA